MKNALKNLTNIFIALIFMLTSVICMVGVLGSKMPSASQSFCYESSISLIENSESEDDSLFFIDLTVVKQDESFVYVYDNKDSTIKIIDKNTNNYRENNNHYRFYNLKDFVIYQDVIMMLDSTNDSFTCIFSDSLNSVDFSMQENLTSLSSAKKIEIISTENKDYILLCPEDPTLSNFEIAEISLEKHAVSGTEFIDKIVLNNIKTFKISDSWETYNEIFISTFEDDLFVMMLAHNELGSFIVELDNILDTYSTRTSITGLDNLDNIRDVAQIKLNPENENILIAFDNKICFYDLVVDKNISANLNKLDLEISLNDFPTTSLNVYNSTLAIISNQKQALKILNYQNQPYIGFNETTVVNDEISPLYYKNENFSYLSTVGDTDLLSSPYSKTSILTIPENANIVNIGKGIYQDGSDVHGWHYVMYSVNNQNYYGYIDSISTNNLVDFSYEKKYVTCFAHTKLYSLPSKFTDNINQEIKTIKESSRLEVLSPICNYSVLNTSYLLVKVNGNEIGFIDESRVLPSSGVNNKIIPNATVLKDNSEIFTSIENDKEIICYLNSGDRVKVIGKRDTKTNYTKVSFNDSEGNEYTGYIYTHNLKPDSWSMLQILGMFLVSLNVILLIVIICIKNRLAR